jgi:hypothetical protein
MNTSPIYFGLMIVVLAVIAGIVYFTGKRKIKRLTPLAGLAFGFVLSGLMFGEARYGLMAIGILLAVVDILRKWRRSRNLP